MKRRKDGTAALETYPESSPERVIATGRLVLAAFGLVAIWYDPSQPALNASVTYGILLVYVAYSAALLAVSVLISRPAFVFQVTVHAMDIGVFSALMALTEGQTSPFFTLFMFALFAAVLRWSSRGVILTALALVICFLLIGITGQPIDPDEGDVTRRIIRGAYLVVAAGFMAYLGVLREGSMRRLAQIAVWPPDAVAAGDTPLLEKPLRHAASMVGAARVLVLWEEGDEPYLNCGTVGSGGFAFRRLPPRADEPPIDESLADRPFVVVDAAAGTWRTRYFGRLHRGQPIAPWLVAEYAIRRAVVVPVRAQELFGHLILLDPRRQGDDALLLAEIAGGRIGGTIQRHLLRRRLVDAAAEQERSRVFRDIHDSLLQTLTATSLRLGRLAETLPEDARPALREIDSLVRNQQHQLRHHIRRMRDPTPTEPKAFGIRDELGNRLAEVATQWDCNVTIEVEPPDAAIPGPLGSEISLMASEAVANAVRHGGARSVHIAVAVETDRLCLTCGDDGIGFRMRPERSAAGEPSRGHLPQSLYSRAQSLEGCMKVIPSEAGGRLKITLPIR